MRIRWRRAWSNWCRRLSREHLTVGIILLVFGVFAFQISPWLAWFTVGSGLLLLTWHARIRNTYRGLLYFIALLPVLHWFNSINEFLFHEDAVTGMMLSRDSASPLELVYGLIFAVVAIGGLIFVIRHRPYVRAIQAATGGTGNRQNKQARWSNVPARTFADVGGMDDQKSRISAIVQNRLYPERFKQHGVIQNGILLYGPRGTGKTFLAEATAGEFKINYWYAKPTSLIESRIGNSEANIRETFSRAYAHRPVLFFLDEIDSIGTQRQQLGRNDDVGGGARLYNSVVTELMQCIDQYRGATGFILMAATNFYDGLDEALVRDMRFDEKIRVDLPDEATRAQILSAQLSKRLWTPFSVDSFAKRTPGWSAAKLSGLVNKAASIAALENRRIEVRDLQRAFDESGGQDRPLVKASRLGRPRSPCRNRTGPAKSDSADGCSGGRKAQGSGPDRVTSGRPCRYRQNLHCAPDCDPDAAQFLRHRSGGRSDSGEACAGVRQGPRAEPVHLVYR